jgi:hypothetical protein
VHAPEVSSVHVSVPLRSTLPHDGMMVALADREQSVTAATRRRNWARKESFMGSSEGS